MGMLIIVLLVFYFLPTIVASVRRHHNAAAVLVLNLFLGWTFIGWVAALVWSATAVDPSRGANRYIDELSPAPADPVAGLTRTKPEPFWVGAKTEIKISAVAVLLVVIALIGVAYLVGKSPGNAKSDRAQSVVPAATDSRPQVVPISPANCTIEPFQKWPDGCSWLTVINEDFRPAAAMKKRTQDGNESKKNAPDEFRGIKWDAPLLSAQKIRETALKGCVSIIEQKNLVSNAPCSHLHIDNDDIDVFAQRQNVALLFEVPISEQTLSWSYKKFWAGDVYIYNYKPADLAKLRAAIVEHYGPPTIVNDSQHLTEWDWADKKIKVRLTFDPVPKPGIGDRTPKTAIWLHVAKD